ncbi:MAG TPA: hypothetical protein VKP69_03200, partial [Isosphaeraceae bacterium]|nr:hypothetical protein [Isosphaeraceae bacterium]
VALGDHTRIVAENVAEVMLIDIAIQDSDDLRANVAVSRLGQWRRDDPSLNDFLRVAGIGWCLSLANRVLRGR